MAINGILLLDKAIGVTSNKALQQVKNLFKAKKAGHTGNLDPLASGLLPICFGEATKFAGFLLESDKSYLVTAKLGESTDTGDSDGKLINKVQVPALNF
jgi:tRNA pseudouridine55 synthase